MAVGIKVGKGAGAKRPARLRRHLRVRKKVSGTSTRPRLVVTRSTRHMVAQIVDDTAGRTLASAVDGRGRARPQRRQDGQGPAVGTLVAERAKAAGIDSVVFDRGGNRYHGRVAALAEGAREGGLGF
jgi:large subunit ribosomal protein L18